MFGTFRVFLALMVLFSHVYSQAILHYNFGCMAVVCFFMVSGYVMTILIRTQYGRLGWSSFYFYADRFLRIYPQYLLFITLVQIADFNWYLQSPFLKTEPTLWKFFLNALIVPVNYFMFLSDSIAYYQLITPAWSLGLEEQFYWIFPFLLLMPWMGRSFTFISCLIFALGTFGILDRELFIIRLLPGVIFIFMLGKSLADFNFTKSEEAFWTAAVLYVGAVILAVWLWLFRMDIFAAPFVKEVLAGILLGFPIMAYLSRLPRKKWDEVLGHASYGIFLSHFLVFETFGHFKLFKDDYWRFMVAAIICSVTLGFLGYYLVEKPTIRFRHALRKKHAQSIQQG